MKDRVEATLSAIAEAEEAMMRARVLLKNLQTEPIIPAASHPVFIPDAALKDEPPSRAA